MEAGLDQTGLARIMAGLETLQKQVDRAIGKDAAPMRTWLYERNGSHYVGWYTPDRKRRSKSCGRGAGGLKAAKRLAEKINAELVTDTYNPNSGKTWVEFRQEYEQQAACKSTATQKEIRLAFNAFERIIRPARMATVRTSTLDRFARERANEESPVKPGETVSPATVNKELRHLKAALVKARKWGYLPEMPDVEMLREAEKLPRYAPPEHFAALYAVCPQARMPTGCVGYSAGEWWQALLIFAYMTGWRIGQLMAVRRDDTDLVNGWATARANVAGNKAKRERRTPLHPIVIEHLRKLQGFSEAWFPWPHDERSRYRELHRLCRLAGIPEYGFHDFRRGFATVNADRMSGDALQEYMQHGSYQTTQRYIAVARQMRPAMAAVFVPQLTAAALSASQ